MLYNDLYVLKFLTRSDGRLNAYLCIWNNLKNRNETIYDYIKNRYNDIDEDDTVGEILYRIKNNVDNKPKCLICGKTKHMFNGNHYKIYCSENCEYSKEGNKNILLKRELTNIKKFGVKQPLQCKDIKERMKETNFKKYGAVSPMLNKNILEKARLTCLKKYGVDRYSKTEECKEKYKLTCLERYGVDNIIKLKETLEKIKNTSLLHYGVEHWFKSEKFKDKIIDIMKNNKTYKFSKIEILFYNYLKDKYSVNDIIQLYKSNLYPFHCDFYIKSLDVYIEINGTWTHGYHPFDENNTDDIKKLNFWKSKNTIYYNSAIKTWTITDPLKRKIAKENKLNYLEIFSIKLNTCIIL